MLSPTLFNLYINEAIENLSQANIKVLAYADDLVFVAKSQIELYRGLNILQRWCDSNGISINKRKSAIFYLRPDKRTPVPFHSTRGFPVVTNYTYLGIEFDDSFTFIPAEKKVKYHMTQLKSKLQMTWALKLPQRTRFRAWQSLIVSRFMYGMTMLASISDKMATTLHTLWYRAIKGLLSIRGNPKKETLVR